MLEQQGRSATALDSFDTTKDVLRHDTRSIDVQGKTTLKREYVSTSVDIKLGANHDDLGVSDIKESRASLVRQGQREQSAMDHSSSPY